jgi:ferredoxin-NADP reductase
VVTETAAVCSIYLAAEDGSPLPAAQAGLYVTLRVAGAGQPPPVRSHSLSSAPGDSAYRISVKAEPTGEVSQYLKDKVRAGSTLEVAAPRGDFELDDGSGPVLLMSAGIGVTPVLSMLHQLAQTRSEREIWWILSARSPREQPFAAESAALLRSLPHTRVHVFYSRATPTELRRQHAVSGHVTKEALAALRLPAGAQAYVCGPDAYMADMRAAPRRRGHRACQCAHGTVRDLASHQSRCGRSCRPGAPPATRTAGHRSAGHLRAQRSVDAVWRELAEPPRPGRCLRRAEPVELPDRRVPHLRHAAAIGRTLLLAGPAGGAVRRSGARLLLPAPLRHRAGHVSGSRPAPWASGDLGQRGRRLQRDRRRLRLTECRLGR